ncbi:hypothetical protein JCM3775_001249 [Rhodotorula graminis]
MLSTSRASAHLASLRRLARRPELRAAAIYLVVQPATAVLAALVGSTSEYRFPHPLVATLLHLALALAALVAASLAAKVLRHRRHVPPPRPTLVSSALDSLASILPSRPLSSPEPSASCSSRAFLAALSSTLTALAELRAHRTLDPAVFAAVRLAPLVLAPLVALVPLPPPIVPRSLGPARRAEAGAALVCGIVLGAGRGVALEGWWDAGVVALAWAVGALGWVLCLSTAGIERAEVAEGFEEDGLTHRRRSSSRPSLLVHLLLSLLFLFIPTLLSPELANIRRSRHHTFFLEPGFWARETAAALVSLAGLSAFWHLASTLDPLPTLALVALKDRLVVPCAFNALLGNPLDGLERGRARLSERQQVAALGLLGAWAVVRALGEREWEDGRGGRRKKR